MLWRRALSVLGRTSARAPCVLKATRSPPAVCALALMCWCRPLHCLPQSLRHTHIVFLQSADNDRAHDDDHDDRDDHERADRAARQRQAQRDQHQRCKLVPFCSTHNMDMDVESLLAPWLTINACFCIAGSARVITIPASLSTITYHPSPQDSMQLFLCAVSPRH